MTRKRSGAKKEFCSFSNEFPDAYKASAYDDPLVIEGNATLGDELSAKNFDEIIVPVGGGGLISGISKGLCRQRSSGKIDRRGTAEMANDAARSLKAGEIVNNEHEPQTFADGARTIQSGKT